MTQYAMPTIDPTVHTGTDLANFLNASYPALYSQHRGSSRPGYALPGMIWIDSSVAGTDSVRYYDGTNDILLYSFNTTTGEVVAGGPFTPGVMINRGSINPTIAAPASPRNGDQYFVGTAGTAHATFTGLSGTAMTVGDLIYYNGANWQAIRLQSIVGNYLPLAGGTLTGNAAFSGASVSQPFTSVLPANNGGRIGVQHSTNGGFQIQGASASAIAFLLTAYSGLPNALSTTQGVVALNAVKHDGSGGVASLANSENAFSISNNGAVRFLIKGSGSTLISGGLTVADGQFTSLGGDAEIAGALSVGETIVADLQGDVDGTATTALTANALSTPRTITVGNTGKSFDGTADISFSLAEIGAGSGISNGTSSVTIPTANNEIVATTAGVARLRITAAGTIATGGETAPDVDPGGICIFNGAADGNAMSFKNSDVAHPFIAQYETDTYGIFQKFSPSAGGLAMIGLSEASSSALYLAAHMQTPGTVLGTNNGAILLNAFKSNGTTGLAALLSTEIALTIKTGNAFLTQLTGNGSLYQLGSIATGGEIAPDADIGGITTYTTGGGGTNLTLKNSSVNHGITAVAETDTYGILRKSGTTAGGLLIRGLSSGSEGLFLTAQVTTPNAATGYAPVTLHASKASGTGTQSIAASESVLGIYNNSSASIFRVMGNGDVRSQGGIATGGETAPDVAAGGVSILTGAAGFSLSLKNSAVAHPGTNAAEADTYASFSYINTFGGLDVSGYAATNRAIRFRGRSSAPSTTDTVAGVTHFDSIKNTAAADAALADNENLATFGNNAAVKLTIKGNGDVRGQGGLTLGGAAAGGSLVDPNALKIRHSGGGNPGLITAVSDSFASPWTAYPSNQMWGLMVPSASAGGFFVNAVSTLADVPPLAFFGVGVGSLDQPAMAWNAAKHNGAGGIVDLADNEILLRVSNGLAKLLLKGNGDMTIAGGLQLSNGTAKLSRYEEGTFTPVLTGSSGGSLTPGHVAVGTYTRIGRQVTAHFVINLDNTHSVDNAYAGNITITGLPFTAAGPANMRYSVAIGSFENISGYKTGYVAAGTNVITLVTLLINITGGSEAPLTSANLGASPGICGSVTYEVAA